MKPWATYLNNHPRMTQQHPDNDVTMYHVNHILVMEEIKKKVCRLETIADHNIYFHSEYAFDAGTNDIHSWRTLFPAQGGPDILVKYHFMAKRPDKKKKKQFFRFYTSD